MKKTYVITPLLFLFPSMARACAVCFGGADGNLVRGFTWGVIVLGLLPFVLFAGIFTMIVRATNKNAKSHE